MLAAVGSLHALLSPGRLLVPPSLLLPLALHLVLHRAQVYMKLGQVERALADLTAVLYNDSRWVP